MRLDDLKRGDSIFIDANIFIYNFGRSVELKNEFIKESAQVRQSEGLLTNDSIVAASMKILGLSKIATNDSDFDRIKWIRIYQPSDL